MNHISPLARYYSIKQAIDITTYSRGKLNKLIQNGKIIAYRDNGRILLDKHSVDAYLASLPRETFSEAQLKQDSTSHRDLFAA